MPGEAGTTALVGAGPARVGARREGLVQRSITARETRRIPADAAGRTGITLLARAVATLPSRAAREPLAEGLVVRDGGKGARREPGPQRADQADDRGGSPQNVPAKLAPSGSAPGPETEAAEPTPERKITAPVASPAPATMIEMFTPTE